MRVIIDESAWSDLDNIALRIARDSATAAHWEVEKIRHVIDLLGELPALSQDGRAKGTRERVVSGGRYVIVFEIWKKPRA
jgi:plasmid stabilization system protein ParE